MKAPSICLIIVVLTVCKIYAQPGKSDLNPIYKKHVSIPLYKENSTIDSLINTAIKGVYSRDKYFIFRSVKVKNDYNFNLFQLEQKRLGIVLDFKLDYYSKIRGYFKFKGCTVFIIGEYDSGSNFFFKRNGHNSFDFMWDKYNDEDPLKRRMNLFSNWYIYKNGRFSFSLSSNY